MVWFGKIFLSFSVFIIFVGFFAIPRQKVYADICYSSRSFSQYACTPADIDCAENPADCCSPNAAINGYRCSGNNAVSCNSVTGVPCDSYGPYNQDIGSCRYFCSAWQTGEICQQLANILVPCNPAPACNWTGQVSQCSDPAGPSTCAETNPTLTYGCWGAGNPTATPTNTPGGPTPTRTPTPTAGPTATPTPTPYCGNGTCDIGEDACSCPVGECGVCPPNNGTLQSRAKIIPQGSASCADVTASSTPLTGTVFDIKQNGTTTWQGAQTQTDINYVSWTANEGTYTLSVDPPAGYVQQVVCPSTNPLTSVPITANSTYTVDIGFTAGTPWNRVVGGDVYAGNILRSLVSETLSAANRHFITDGAGGYPGIATYGNSYDFDPGAGLGATYVSSTGWLADDLFPVIDYYDEFYESFGGTPGTFDYTGPVTLASRPAYKADMETPFYVNGDLTIDGADWSVGNDNKMIFIIDGNLIIKNNINLTENGFIAFIVDGNISIDDSVGGQYNTTTPVIEGIYITSLGGTFDTGGSSVDGFEKLVLEGIFVANDFSLRRDLSTANPGGNQNANQASSRFVYNPMLLLEMPDAMMNSNVIWQEVAP